MGGKRSQIRDDHTNGDHRLGVNDAAIALVGDIDLIYVPQAFPASCQKETDAR
jgi:hypothetical protein